MEKEEVGEEGEEGEEGEKIEVEVCSLELTSVLCALFLLHLITS